MDKNPSCSFSYQGQTLFKVDLPVDLQGDEDALLTAARSIRHRFVEALNHEKRTHIAEGEVAIKLADFTGGVPTWDLTVTHHIRIIAQSPEVALKRAPKDYRLWQPGNVTVLPSSNGDQR